VFVPEPTYVIPRVPTLRRTEHVSIPYDLLIHEKLAIVTAGRDVALHPHLTKVSGMLVLVEDLVTCRAPAQVNGVRITIECGLCMAGEASGISDQRNALSLLHSNTSATT